MVGVMTKGLLKGTVGTSAKLETKKDVLLFPVRWAADQVPISLAKPGPAAVPTLGASWLATTTGKSITKLPQWVVHHKYPLMVLVAVNAARADALNEKMKPVGTNAIALNQPTLLGPTKAFPLHDAVRQYFIRNQDRTEDRLYLVSPCKTKLRIKKANCDCASDPNAHRFSFGTRYMQDVKPGTISLKQEEIVSLNDAERSKVDELYERLTTKESSGATVPADFAPLSQYFDSESAIKQCVDKKFLKNAISTGTSYIADLFTGSDSGYWSWKDYEIPCVELEVERVDYEGNENYCYDKFVVTGYIRNGILGGAFILDLIITVGSGTTLAPVGLFLTAASIAVTDTVLANWE